MGHNRSFFKKLFLAIAVIGMFAGGVYYNTSCSRGPLYEYQADRDFDALVKLFEKNLYWLTVRDNSSGFKFYLKYATPNENPLNFGKLKTKVLRENNEVVGFISYFMSSPTVGKILFIAVDEKVRGKRYGEKLMLHAMNELKKVGAYEIKLVTRPSNKSAHALYKRVGFYETARDDVHTYHTYDVR